MNLFKKAACFTDIHFGLRHNSRQHNDDCESFINWFCEESNKRGAETCMFLGDFHHHRNTINVSTLNYTISNLTKLSESFDEIYFIIGNHDLYYREKREIHSIPMGELFPNMTLINEPILIKDVYFVPWLINNEWRKIVTKKAKYMFGHFELPGFKMNAKVEMPDHGGINKTKFKNQDYVFSGHFHKRQEWQNIHYIGNPFGHNYADSWDFDRGAMFLEWGGKPEYVNWEVGPKYMTTSISQLAEDPRTFLVPDSYIRASVDVDLSYEEVNFLKETFIEQFKIRELKLLPQTLLEGNESGEFEISFESVDEIVVSQISTLESDVFNKNKLIEIYNEL